MMDAIAWFANHVVATRYEDVPAAALQLTKTFLMDTGGVGVAGSGALQCLPSVREAWIPRACSYLFS
jgi:aconitate decarboxylase